MAVVNGARWGTPCHLRRCVHRDRVTGAGRAWRRGSRWGWGGDSGGEGTEGTREAREFQIPTAACSARRNKGVGEKGKGEKGDDGWGRGISERGRRKDLGRKFGRPGLGGSGGPTWWRWADR
jgi:hypothetical protein